MASPSSPRPTTPTLLPAVTGVSSTTTGNNLLNSNNGSSRLEPASPPRPPLLREWQQEQSSPPVAPAVVVDATATYGDRRGSGYTYPVATFVRDLVRTGMDQINLAAALPTRGATHVEETTPLSVRSEADAEALAAALRPSIPNQGASAVSARTVNEYFGNETEFILVDGDLIPVPPETTHEQDLIQDRIRDHDIAKTCQTPHPKKMRKGMKRISKFFKKVRRGSSNKDAVVVGRDGSGGFPIPEIASAGTEESAGAPAELPQLQQQHESGDELAPKKPPALSPKRRGLRRQRRSWKKDQQRRGLSPSQSKDQQQGDGSGEEQEIGTMALTGLERPSTMDDGHTDVPPLSSRYHNQNYLDPLSPPPTIPRPMDPIAEASRTASVTAVFVGTNDQIEQPGFDMRLLPTDVAAVAFIEDTEDMSYYKKDDGVIVPSLLPPDADYKVDKSDAPDFESMLMRAACETTNDLDSSDLPAPSLRGARGKSDSAGDAVPLSQARVDDIRRDYMVYNDTLKIVMVAPPDVDKSWVARRLRNSQKRPRKRATLGVDVHNWVPCNDEQRQDDFSPQIKFMIWDVQGATGSPADCANFGAHPGTQSLFFSGQALYLLVYDLAYNNPRTVLKTRLLSREDSESDASDDSDDDDNEYADAFVEEVANRKADRAMLADISRRVLPWVDTIASRGPNSAILPVAVIPPGMSEIEVKRRCNMMQNSLVEYVNRYEGVLAAPKLLSSADEKVLCVDYNSSEGIDRLQETIQAIAADASRSVFSHVGTKVPPGTVEVLDSIRRFKEQHKLVLLDHLLGELEDQVEVKDVIRALQFLSNIGEILYFSSDDDVLSRYIILSRKWLVSALSCILRNDLRRELSETRRFMNMQCIYSHQQFPENDVIIALASGTNSSCPLLSDGDAKMLWQSMSFMREAADHYSQLSESSTSTPTMFYFLERLLLHAGVFLALDLPDQFSLEQSNVFFVPSLLAQADPGEVWTYKSVDSWKATLCHSWLFRDGVPPNLMERLTVQILGEIYSFAREFHGDQPHNHHILNRSHTVPIRNTSRNELLEEHAKEAVGRPRVHQIVCWNSSMLIKIGTIFADPSSGDLKESFVEMFVAIADQCASYCVASDAMRAGMQRVIVSGKGQAGHHGRKIWKGGYEVVLNAVRGCLSKSPNVDTQVICPECLARSSPRSASTWSWDSVRALSQAPSDSSIIRCIRGHRVDSNLVCGTAAPRKVGPGGKGTGELVKATRSIPELLPSVVLVGLWDPQRKKLRNVGSGFIVDRKLGLIATAGHVLFEMKRGRSFGIPYCGIPMARVVIGVIDGDDNTAKFRYFGDIVSDDIHSVDACIVRITTRLEHDVDDEGAGCADQAERLISSDAMKDEKLPQLKLAKSFETEEPVRILGYSQNGEGVYEKGKHVFRSAGWSKGYISHRFQAPVADDSSSSDSSSHTSFAPREEIVIICPTISGHSGGPCVNDEGKVVGLLSRGDPVDYQRSYLVPSHEIKALVNNAKKHCTRTANMSNISSP